MSSTPATVRGARPLGVRLGVWMCLLAWFAGTPLLLPGLVAALGGLDLQHRVQCEERGGRVAVIFHHGCGAQTPAHRHSSLARVLTALAGPDRTTPDHILTFAHATEASATAATVVATPLFVALPRFGTIFVTPDSPEPSRGANRASRPPPALSSALVCLRSTVLLV